MRTKQIVGTLAVAGAVATLAIYNLNALPSHSSFLAEPTSEYEQAFNAFITKYHKSYGTKEEYDYRLGVFSKNFHNIKAHNMMNDASFSLGVNQFSDMTSEEFKKMLGFKPELKQENEAPEMLEVEGLPESVDWRKEGAVTPVKNQG